MFNLRGGGVKLYFKKKFNLKSLPEVEYYRCSNCGFVFSKTHYEMNEVDWIALNDDVHHKFYSADKDDFEHEAPFLQQALFFHILALNKIIETDMWLDYGAGLGNFANVLKTYFGYSTYSYDKYITPVSNWSNTIKGDLSLYKDKFNMVFSSAVLEHITNLETIEEMMSCLSEKGAFSLHTLVCENIPNDPNWFYLLPVHCSFFTNSSMDILMKKYGFAYSIYSPFSKTWVLFKNKPTDIDDILNEVNQSLRCNYIYGKSGFVDYWKGF